MKRPCHVVMELTTVIHTLLMGSISVLLVLMFECLPMFCSTDKLMQHLYKHCGVYFTPSLFRCCNSKLCNCCYSISPSKQDE